MNGFASTAGLAIRWRPLTGPHNAYGAISVFLLEVDISFLVCRFKSSFERDVQSFIGFFWPVHISWTLNLINIALNSLEIQFLPHFCYILSSFFLQNIVKMIPNSLTGCARHFWRMVQFWSKFWPMDQTYIFLPNWLKNILNTVWGVPDPFWLVCIAFYFLGERHVTLWGKNFLFWPYLC